MSRLRLSFGMMLTLLFLSTGLLHATPLPIPRIGAPLDNGAGPSVPLDDVTTAPSSVQEDEGHVDMLPSAHFSPADILERSSPAIVTVMAVLAHEGPVRGTGFFATSDGLILTSHHLIDGAINIKIKTRNGKIYNDVTVVDARPEADLAVLRINGLKTAEPYLMMGDSELVRVGEPIAAIGHPLGLEYSLSSGLVSALRAAEINGLDLIQFSAPVSPGCSGGPILNSSGQVIGIICLSHPEGQNLNFAIPINYGRQMLSNLQKPAQPDVHALAYASSRPPAPPCAVPNGVELVPNAPTIVVSAPGARRVFRAGTRGFSLNCPPAWTCHSQRTGNGITIAIDSPDHLIHIDLVSLHAAAGRLDAFADETMRKVNATLLSSDLEASEVVAEPRGPRLIRVTHRQVGAVNWKMFVHRYTDTDGNDDYEVTMLALHSGQGYMIRATAPVSSWPRVRRAIEQVMAGTEIL